MNKQSLWEFQVSEAFLCNTTMMHVVVVLVTESIV